MREDKMVLLPSHTYRRQFFGAHSTRLSDAHVTLPTSFSSVNCDAGPMFVGHHQPKKIASSSQLRDRRTAVDFKVFIIIASKSSLSDDEFVSVTVSGVLYPSESDWVAMVSPSHPDVSSCPIDEITYAQTGDLSKLPPVCHYPVKAQFVSNDPDYLKFKKKECKKSSKGVCQVTTCSGMLSFHVINIRTDIEFVFFAGGFELPCILNRSKVGTFANPNKPLYGHLSSVDSTATSMRLTWVSGDKEPQQVQYGDGKSQASEVTTFSQDKMCSSRALPSPAKDFGWHDPGYIHSAVMTGLQPSSTFSYRYGSDSVGWSNQIQFRTPPAGGSDELKFLAFGDMGKAPRDASVEHYIQIMNLLCMEIFRDYADSGSVYVTPDSGGECGVAYAIYFPMPTEAKDKPWYTIEQASVHFTVMSTEHDWTENSEQYEWMKKDMASIDRSNTPWLIFTGHRSMYSSVGGLLGIDDHFVEAIEPLLLANEVDLALFGHVHNYERTCAVYQKECKAMPVKDENGIDTYNNNNYSAPVQAVIGVAGFTLDSFPSRVRLGWLKGAGCNGEEEEGEGEGDVTRHRDTHDQNLDFFEMRRPFFSVFGS
ncbi:hypothetical protein L1049_011567 [Liquidambar formosana]|uniref:Purple acid phosphatase n=1 Tax=Liquidambar formosana TaxID=63359 RepID=A0AAP0X2C4_LIQFO